MPARGPSPKAGHILPFSSVSGVRVFDHHERRRLIEEVGDRPLRGVCDRVPVDVDAAPSGTRGGDGLEGALVSDVLDLKWREGALFVIPVESGVGRQKGAMARGGWDVQGALVASRVLPIYALQTMALRQIRHWQAARAWPGGGHSTVGLALPGLLPAANSIRTGVLAAPAERSLAKPLLAVDPVRLAAGVPQGGVHLVLAFLSGESYSGVRLAEEADVVSALAHYNSRSRGVAIPECFTVVHVPPQFWFPSALATSAAAEYHAASGAAGPAASAWRRPVLQCFGAVTPIVDRDPNNAHVVVVVNFCCYITYCDVWFCCVCEDDQDYIWGLVSRAALK